MIDIQKEINSYEAKYNMETCVFIIDWERGYLDHGNNDFARWALLAGLPKIK